MFRRDSEMEAFKNWGAETLRKIYETVQGHFDQLRTPPRPQAPRPEHDANPHRDSQITWNSSQLKGTIYKVAQSGEFISQPPDSFDFTDFFRPCKRLEDLTRDGLEYGRIATIDTLSKKIAFGQTVRGNSTSVEIPVRVTPFQVPFLAVHSHPSYAAPSRSYHLSPEDMCSFLKASPLQFQVVVAEGLTLIAMRTDKTPTFSEAVERRVMDCASSLRNSVASYGTGDPASRFTRDICRQLNIALYRIKHAEVDASGGRAIARRVIN